MRIPISIDEALAAGDYSKPVRLVGGRLFWIKERPVFPMFSNWTLVEVEPADEPKEA